MLPSAYFRDTDFKSELRKLLSKVIFKLFESHYQDTIDAILQLDSIKIFIDCVSNLKFCINPIFGTLDFESEVRKLILKAISELFWIK